MAPRTERDPRLDLTSLYCGEVNHELWEQLPPERRQRYFTRATMPAEYLAAILENRPYFRAREMSVALNLRDLPEPMTRELAWCLHRTVELGRTIYARTWNQFTNGLTLAIDDDAMVASLLSLSEDEWRRRVMKQVARVGSVPGRTVFHTTQWLRKCLDLLAPAYHRGEWWQLDVWNPHLDPRIPLRDHEPEGHSVVNFSRLTTPWLREAAKWWLKTCLETGWYTWTSVGKRLDSLIWLQRFVDVHGVSGPDLAPYDQLRAWCSDFVGYLRTSTARSGPTKGQALSAASRRVRMAAIENFYRFMDEHRIEAASVLEEAGWLRLGIQHSVLFRPQERPRCRSQVVPDRVLEDGVVEKIAAGAHVLAEPLEKGGMGDEQALRALMLLIRTGRRANEILMLDFDPLLPLARPLGDGDHGFVAKLRYQQTKVLTNDPTIPIDAEMVAVVRAQQEWARTRMATLGRPDATPRYLFLGTRSNLNGLRPYPAATFRALLGELGRRLDLRDSHDRPVPLGKTHRFRHTQATNLLNAGVPLHVVMRYLGHITPTMTMHYAQTLSQTAEREFLKYKKVTADGRTLNLDSRDLYDVLELDRRTDRILPNGFCLLPPRQVCPKGNACLTCGDFVTDARFRPELAEQMQRTEQLIQQRQELFTTRHGVPMTPDNIWLAGRLREVEALRKILAAVELSGEGKEQVLAIRGAGVVDRG